jgi:hypothetical protein
MMPDDHPQLAPPFLPPVEVPAAPHPRRRYPPWLPWLAIALAPVVAICTAVGAYTMAKAVVRSYAPRVTATNTAHTQAAKVRQADPTPTYDLAGYQAAISGPQEQALLAALNQFRADSKRYKFQSLTTDSLSLTTAATSWLSALRHTSPPPGYQASKLNYILAATLANRAATQTQGGIASADLTALQKGAALATQARQALTRATQSAPHGS